MNRLIVCAPLGVEQAALRGRVPGATVVRVGMGPGRVARRLPGRLPADTGAVVVAGVAGALTDDVRPGDVVVATEVRGPDGRVVPCPAHPPLVAGLRRLGLTVHAGPIVSSARVVTGAARRELAAGGALAVEMEAAAVAAVLERRRRSVPAASGHPGGGSPAGAASADPAPGPAAAGDAAGGLPFAVVRVIIDTPSHPLLRPATLRTGARALGVLRRTAPVLAEWAAAAGPRSVTLAAPRSFCAGVERAIEIVERALDKYGAPVYVRRQIVHNAHVVEDLAGRGAVFVEELHEVPDGATVVFSAHGVAPSVRDDAESRDLMVIDATCPLVGKVHTETRRYLRRGDSVLLVGHDHHDETEGVLGEAPGRIQLVSTVEEAERIEVSDPRRVAHVTQTTLAVEEAQDIVNVLRRRFPEISGPAREDICYATTNRQDAVRAVAADSDLLLVVGSANSSNSLRLVEVAERTGTRAHLIDDPMEIDPAWLVGARRVGLSAGASAPPHLVNAVVDTLRGLGPVEVNERAVTEENYRFALPKEVS